MKTIAPFSEESKPQILICTSLSKEVEKDVIKRFRKKIISIVEEAREFESFPYEKAAELFYNKTIKEEGIIPCFNTESGSVRYVDLEIGKAMGFTVVVKLNDTNEYMFLSAMAHSTNEEKIELRYILTTSNLIPVATVFIVLKAKKETKSDYHT